MVRTGGPAVTTDGTGDPRDVRTAAWLGAALGIAFAVCFATGVWSHVAQDPPAWYPVRPAGLYRITQGVHVVTGTATIPLLVAKLWVVHRHLFARPPVRSTLHAVERLALLPLVGGAVFMLLSGTANVARWYPWGFFFPRAHYWVAWITIGALVVHLGAKWATTTDALRRRPRAAAPEPARAGGADRRSFLAGVAVSSGALAVASAGGTLSPLSGIAVLAQRRPGLGPQGLPVNKTAVGARVVEVARDPDYRLVVDGAVRRRLSLTRADLLARPQRRATLPIACVEGWSASADWAGVPVRDLLALAGARDHAEVAVESLQPSGLYRASVLDRSPSGRRGHVAGADPAGRGARHRPRLPGPPRRTESPGGGADQVGPPPGGAVSARAGPDGDMPDTTSRRGLLVGLALGLPVIAYGLRGVLIDADRTHPAELARWVVGSALVADLLLVPAVIVVGAVACRATPRPWWPTVRTALMVTGSLALVAWPFVRGYGRDSANPSLLPRDYAGGLAAAVAVVWAVAAAVLAGRWAAHRRGGTRPPGPRA